ncbi:thiamine biosynthesis protein ThiS [Vibrio sp. 10N.286.49.B3]|uniref:sulfur carrier protein ThiS n=1 Tax=Vibrio sp. 10N.286.49.B3 TaxID=1880855 RepID=UPI000C8159B0|nr:sulfur carrier protein ThiS [Vibrio sp. 10N.286.49.B3]PMH38681.1 thiamine biosynthesis protein ThiS [Vibrio sp. 10N.286.49.B3]
MSNITISVNDKSVEAIQGSTIDSVLNTLDLPTLGCAVALNQTIIPRTQWDSVIVNTGDSIALFQAIAGG